MLEIDRQLFTVVPLSLALILSGLVHVFLPRLSQAGKFLISSSVFAAAFALIAQIAESQTFELLAIATVPASMVLALALRVLSGSQAPVCSRRSIVTGIGIAIVGSALLAFSLVRHEIDLDQQVENDSRDMEMMAFVPEREIDTERQLVTDRGQSIPLWRAKQEMSRSELDSRFEGCMKLLPIDESVVTIGSADDRTNCHGWVFTGGRSIVSNADVEIILADNGYQLVQEPQVGDIAIYRNHGQVSHTARICSVEPGQPIMVESKWSWMGVFRHAVDRSIYGKDYSFYRTSRSGHLVRIADRSTATYGGAE